MWDLLKGCRIPLKGCGVPFGFQDSILTVARMAVSIHLGPFGRWNKSPTFGVCNGVYSSREISTGVTVQGSRIPFWLIRQVRSKYWRIDCCFCKLAGP